MQHEVLRNHPTLSIGTERLAWLNNPHGVQLVTLARGRSRVQTPASAGALRSPPSLPSSFGR